MQSNEYRCPVRSGLTKRWGLLAAALLLSLSACVPAFAQRYAVSTNLVQYANYGTLNGEASMSVARHWTLGLAARYNPFSYTKKEGPVQNKQRAFALSSRWWPWHVYSGWWVGPKAQFQECNAGGMRSAETREGRRVGIAVQGGYSYMIGPHLDLEFGVGVWAGRDHYTTYDCPVCGLTTGEGKKAFLLPDDVVIALTYIF